jgi:hypothetical protein
MPPSSSTDRRPTVDEWGVYDPQQAGLAALYARLTPATGPAEGPAQTAPILVIGEPPPRRPR